MLIGETQEIEEGKKKPGHAHTEDPKHFTTRSEKEEGI